MGKVGPAPPADFRPDVRCRTRRRCFRRLTENGNSGRTPALANADDSEDPMLGRKPARILQTVVLEEARSTMTLSIACAQIASAPFEPQSNFDKAEHFIKEAARQGARLILLPEFLTTNCAYDHRLHKFAEPLDGPTAYWLRRQSRVSGCWIGAGFIEAANDAVYDTFLLAGPMGQLFSYRKQYPAFFELLFFHCGRSLGIFDTPLGRIGTLLCWDMVQPRL